MFHVVLIEPEIPPNTGNIIRLCANTSARLHLVHPLGFSMDDRRLRRAGLDYRELAQVREHGSLAAFVRAVAPARTFAVSTHGALCYADLDYRAGDAFVFGPESRGLPQALLADLGPQRTLRIPMRPGSRSLNLSNAVSVVVFEGWRQLGFSLETPPE
jgi:tRNA (cytidine/uridine-2'-O-)-methyltransferase